MSFTLRRAIREQVPLFIGLSAGTGAGKTLSAIKMATGIAGREEPFALIDTESGRSRHYAPPPGAKPDFITTFLFDTLELDAPYSSKRYQEAIEACKQYPCIVVDQASFEHIGPGGHLEQQQQEVQDRVTRAKQRGDTRPEWQLEEAMNRTSWIKPKHDRKMLIMALIAVRVPVIFCFRAEEKMEIVETVEKDRNGKDVKRQKLIAAKDRPLLERWQPICGKEFEPEMLAFYLLTRDHPKGRGVPLVLKLNEQHAKFADPEKPLDEEAGKLFAAWASGKVVSAANQVVPSASVSATASDTPTHTAEPAEAGGADFISPDAAIDIEDKLREAGITKERFLKAAGATSVSLLPASAYKKSLDWIARAREPAHIK